MCCHGSLVKSLVWFYFHEGEREVIESTVWDSSFDMHVKSITQQKRQPCAFKKQIFFPTNFSRDPNSQKP